MLCNTEMLRSDNLHSRILCFVDRASYYNLLNNQLGAQFFFLYLFFAILYMFRATKCSSSGESTVSTRPLLYVTLCR